MKRICFTVCLALFAVPVLAKETGPVAEVFGCKLNPGKTMTDFDAATKFWQQQVAGIRELDNYLAAVLVPFRARSEYDVLWMGYDDNINALAHGDTAYMAKGGAEVEARFAAAARCDSGLFWTKVLNDTLPEEPNDDNALLELYSCTLRDGKTLGDLEAAHTTFAAANKALHASDAKLANFRFRQLIPYFADTPYDVFYISVNDDFDTFARDATAYVNSKEGPVADAEWAKVIDCESGLWRGHRIHAPRAQKTQ